MDDKTILTLPPVSEMDDSEIAYETQRMAILRDLYASLLRTVKTRQRELESRTRAAAVGGNRRKRLNEKRL